MVKDIRQVHSLLLFDLSTFCDTETNILSTGFIVSKLLNNLLTSFDKWQKTDLDGGGGHTLPHPCSQPAYSTHTPTPKLNCSSTQHAFARTCTLSTVRYCWQHCSWRTGLSGWLWSEDKRLCCPPGVIYVLPKRKQSFRQFGFYAFPYSAPNRPLRKPRDEGDKVYTNLCPRPRPQWAHPHWSLWRPQHEPDTAQKGRGWNQCWKSTTWFHWKQKNQQLRANS